MSCQFIALYGCTYYFWVINLDKEQSGILTLMLPLEPVLHTMYKRDLYVVDIFLTHFV